VSATRNKNDLVRAYRPLDTAAYLRTRGWTQGETAGDRYSLWYKRSPKNEEFEVLLPMALQAPDLALRVAELIDTLHIEEQRPWEDVWEDLSSPYCDIVRARLLASEDGQTLPLEDGAAAFQYVRDLLLAAGCSAWKPRAVFGPRQPDQALQFVRAIRLGQMRPGSYVLKIITPLAEADGRTSLFAADDMPFPRRAMALLATGLQAVVEGVRASAVSGTIEELVNQTSAGVSANLCDALAGLNRIGRGSSSRSPGPRPSLRSRTWGRASTFPPTPWST
jgi:hypothetical protein